MKMRTFMCVLECVRTCINVFVYLVQSWHNRVFVFVCTSLCVSVNACVRSNRWQWYKSSF